MRVNDSEWRKGVARKEEREKRKRQRKGGTEQAKDKTLLKKNA